MFGHGMLFLGAKGNRLSPQPSQCPQFPLLSKMVLAQEQVFLRPLSLENWLNGQSASVEDRQGRFASLGCQLVNAELKSRIYAC